MTPLDCIPEFIVMGVILIGGIVLSIAMCRSDTSSYYSLPVSKKEPSRILLSGPPKPRNVIEVRIVK